MFAEAARLERIGRLRVDRAVQPPLQRVRATTTGPRCATFEDGVGVAASAGLAPPLRHIAATHAAIALPETRLGCVRIGIGIYGLSPFAGPRHRPISVCAPR